MEISRIFRVSGQELLSLDLWHVFALLLPAIVTTFICIRLRGLYTNDLPVLNPKNWWEFTNRRRRAEFIKEGKRLFTLGRQKYPDSPYKLYTDWGEVVVLPPECAEELKNDTRLESLPIVREDVHSAIPGFEGFCPHDSVPYIVTKYLSKPAQKFTVPLSHEACTVLEDVFSAPTDWIEIDPRADLYRIVLRMNTKTYMGEKLSRDDEWTDAFTQYSLLGFELSEVLRAWPLWARGLVHWFLPSCWELRRRLVRIRKLLAAHNDYRVRLQLQRQSAGDESRFNDSIEWFENDLKGKQDIIVFQLNLVLASAHTTSDLLTQAVIGITEHPELFGPLREEVIQVIGTHGWDKSGLNELKRMDSVIKELQRLNPPLLVNFRRRAMADIELRCGINIKAGTRIVVDVMHTLNSSLGYNEKAEECLPYRYLEKRGAPTQRTQAQLVATGVNHMGFGHGRHACPGRFFAAQEIKIILCHMLLKYDWKLKGHGTSPDLRVNGMTVVRDTTVRLLIKRRKEEIDL
ncbi:cytochrome P450 [Fusarium avenaceum]|nr:cytochrome P450 [Fusarium avenaceum]